MNKSFSVTVTPTEKSTVEIKGEITWEAFAAHEEKAFSRLAGMLELDGFRKGAVPADIAKKHLADEMVLADMAELAIQQYYPDIMKEQNLDIIGRPDLAITKIARGNALGFTIRAAVLPEIKLPDYKKLASAVEVSVPTEVTEADVDKVIEDLRQVRAYGHVHAKEDNSDDKHEHSEELPEVNDEFAQSFGAFETVAEMRAKVKENLVNEKSHEAQDKRRIAIMESIVAATAFEIPEVLTHSEQEKMLSQIEADVARSGATLDGYLEHIKKTRDELLAEFKPEAEKRAHFQLTLHAIAKAEKLAPTDEEVKTEADKMMQMYPGADMARAEAYADLVLTNEKVFALLEGR